MMTYIETHTLVKPKAMQLEQRLMFDGAAAVTIVDSTIDAADNDNEAEITENVVSLSPAYEKARPASDLAQKQISDYLSESSVEELFLIFNGGKTEIDSQWLQAMESLKQAFLSGDFDIDLQLLDNETLEGSLGAFTSKGSDGNPVLYLNESYLDSFGDDVSARVIVEELGHAIDYFVNGENDSIGDEGQLFADAVYGSLSAISFEMSESDNDFAEIVIDGENIEVENANYTFVNAYKVLDPEEDTTINAYDIEKESNVHEFDKSQQPSAGDELITGGLGSVTIDDGTGSELFSGNDVSAIGINIDGTTYYGWVSRPIKVGSNVVAFYFWTDVDFTDLTSAQNDGNTDGDRDTSDNSAFLLVVDQAGFDNKINAEGGSIYTIGSSSDRVDSNLNKLVLAANNAPVLEPDTNTVAEDVNATGNVLDNDTDADGDTLFVTQFAVNGQLYNAGETATILDVGTLVINADGSYIFTPDSGYYGSVPIASYVASDSNDTAASTLSIIVTQVNEAPTAVNDTKTVTEDTVATGNIIENDSDPDGDTLVVTAYSFVSNGSTINATIGTKTVMPGVGEITIFSDGTYIFEPAA
ncbi:MAG: cadherin-like domain-containing protein, partial [Proteobacteria bacterium]|nr:cadherin-like domain-containing protein [Pseudomonadota bacterium]